MKRERAGRAPDLTPSLLLAYDPGLAAIRALAAGRERFEEREHVVETLIRFRDLIAIVIRFRDGGRRIPMRCHATLDDMARLDELIPRVMDWLAAGDGVTPDIRTLAGEVSGAVSGSRARVPRGEPWRGFQFG